MKKWSHFWDKYDSRFSRLSRFSLKFHGDGSKQSKRNLVDFFSKPGRYFVCPRNETAAALFNHMVSVCRENHCSCDNGYSTTGDSCTHFSELNPDATGCSSCFTGFHLEPSNTDFGESEGQSACRINACQCSNGIFWGVYQQQRLLTTRSCRTCLRANI